MYDELITSGQNPKIKELLALQEKSRERRRQGLFVVEGRRELEHCLDAGFTPDTIFICPEIFSCHPEARPELVEGRSEGSYPFGDRCKTFHVSPEVYEKIAYRGGTEGIIAEMRYKERKLEDIKLSENPLVIVLESVEKPGNLGAVLRSADAAGADAVIICDPLTDLYNPNLIRSSVGAAFSVPCVACSSEACIGWLKAHGLQILTAQLQDSSPYYDVDMCRPTAIVMGTEATGLTPQWREAADAHIRIPMLGRVDSLNVSVSAAVLMYEAVRQREL